MWCQNSDICRSSNPVVAKKLPEQCIYGAPACMGAPFNSMEKVASERGFVQRCFAHWNKWGKPTSAGAPYSYCSTVHTARWKYARHDFQVSYLSGIHWESLSYASVDAFGLEEHYVKFYNTIKMKVYHASEIMWEMRAPKLWSPTSALVL